MSTWPIRFIRVAHLAMQREDLRQRFIYAKNADALARAPGIVRAYETTVVLAIFEAASMIYSDLSDEMAYEHRYPGINGNPPRADLAFKEGGRGKNWAYIEVKYYKVSGIEGDIQKLQSIKKRAQRWMFIYHVRDMSRNTWELTRLVNRQFGSELEVVGSRGFDTYYAPKVPGACELLLARVIA